jgi:tetratricopeptide (TPR) repeat protein
MKAFLIIFLTSFILGFISFVPRKMLYYEKESTHSASAKKNLNRVIKMCGAINLDHLNDDVTAPLFPGLGNHTFKVTTRSAMAQKYFDQGLTLVYGFNHMEALRSFKQAARLDPNMGMAFWGQALCWGPNINLPMSDEYAQLALDAIQKASQLKSYCNDKEQDMIWALTERYSGDTTLERSVLDQKYADAMTILYDKYPDDLDIKTLYAAAIMNTMPWDYYIDPEHPKNLAVNAIKALEEVLTMDKNHPGANHYYIHIVEPSTTPERGLPSADRLGLLVPGSGHLVHMPSHIYIRTGFYQKAINSNLNAILSDEEYIAQCQAQGVYPGGYYPHNIHFLYSSSSFAGNREMAISAARKLRNKISPDNIDDSYFTQEFLTALYHAYVIFESWNEMLTEPAPSEKHMHAMVVWRYGRGLAFLAKRMDEKAENERLQLKSLVESEPFTSLYPEGSESYKVGQIALNILNAQQRINNGDLSEGIADLEKARSFEDALLYNEPVTWSLPVRWIEGAALLHADQPEKAEALYREDLTKNKDNGWSLYGLVLSLRAQHREEEASEVEKEFQEVWKWADIQGRLMQF